MALHGRNALPEEKETPFLKLVLKQFEDLLVIILLVAAVVSLTSLDSPVSLRSAGSLVS